MGKTLKPLKSKAVKSLPSMKRTEHDIGKRSVATYPTIRTIRPRLLSAKGNLSKTKSATLKGVRTLKKSRCGLRRKYRSAPLRLGPKAERNLIEHLKPLKNRAVKSLPSMKRTESDIGKRSVATYPTTRTIRPRLLSAKGNISKTKSATLKGVRTLKKPRSGLRRKHRSAPLRLGPKAERNLIELLLRQPTEAEPDVPPALPSLDYELKALEQRIPPMATRGNYYDVGQIGEGAFGAIFEVVNRTTKEREVIKVIQKDKYNGNPEFVECLLAELIILLTIKSPFLVKARGWYHDEYNIYIIMERMATDILVERCQQPGSRLDEERAARVAATVLFGLKTLHQQMLMHVDIKEDNILVGKDGSIMLGDFGVARAIRRTGRRTDVYYNEIHRSPEEWADRGVSMKSDMWAVGIMVYRLLNNRNPFGDYLTPSDMEMIRACHVRFPRNVHLSENAKDFITKLLRPEESRLNERDALMHPFILGNMPEEWKCYI